MLLFLAIFSLYPQSFLSLIQFTGIWRIVQHFFYYPAEIFFVWFGWNRLRGVFFIWQIFSLSHILGTTYRVGITHRCLLQIMPTQGRQKQHRDQAIMNWPNDILLLQKITFVIGIVRARFSVCVTAKLGTLMDIIIVDLHKCGHFMSVRL